MKLKLLFALAVTCCCLIRAINCGEKECDNPGIGRIVAVRNGCNVSQTDGATCPVELDWVPGANHDSLNVRLLALKNDIWMVIREGPIPDTKFTTEQQYSSEITLERKELPTPPHVRVEIYQPETVEVCRVAE